MIRYLLVVNPIAGNGTGRERADELARLLDSTADVEIAETSDRGDATRIAAEHATSVDRMIAVGGDGTLNEVLVGLMKAREKEGTAGEPDIADLGFLPSGTANGAVRAFGFSADVAVVARLLPDAERRPIDVGIAEHEGRERPFLLRLGAGLDAAVIEELNASRADVLGPVGVVLNTPRIIEVMRSYEGPDIEIEVDGESFGTAGSVVLTNVAEVGLQATVAQSADPADGRLDVLAVSLPTKMDIIGLGLRMLFSSLQSAEGVRHTTGRRVRLTSSGGAPVQLDGEPIGMLPIDVRLAHRAVRLLITRDPAG